jgi:hypothetical protein
VKRSNVTAVSSTLEFQKPNAVWRIASGVDENVFTILDVAYLLGVTRAECEVASEKWRNVRPITWEAAI